MTDTDIDVRVRERFASLPAGPSADVEAALQEVNRRLRRRGRRRVRARASVVLVLVLVVLGGSRRSWATKTATSGS